MLGLLHHISQNRSHITQRLMLFTIQNSDENPKSVVSNSFNISTPAEITPLPSEAAYLNAVIGRR